MEHIAIQGQAPQMEGVINTDNRWVTGFYVQYSIDGIKWKLFKGTALERSYMTTFKGNKDHRKRYKIINFIIKQTRNFRMKMQINIIHVITMN